MMTTLAVIADMRPLAFSLGESRGFRGPMARAVIDALITSTLLTPVVVPLTYIYFDDFGGWVRREVARQAARAAVLHPVPLIPQPMMRD